MSERTFRAVVAAVLVGFLVLAAFVAASLLPGPITRPVASGTAPPTASTRPTATASPVRGPSFDVPSVVSVGLVKRGMSSGETLRLGLVESAEDGLENAAGTVDIVLADGEGEATVSFVGSPNVSAPGSLGATAELVAPNVLRLSIVASDPLNVESIVITGLGIGASSTAAPGPIDAVLEAASGSLLDAFPSERLASPGSVIASP